jgi:hypothetical protein
MVELKVPAHNGKHYAPHMSDRPFARLNEGQTFTLDTLSLVEILPDKCIIYAHAEIV